MKIGEVTFKTIKYVTAVPAFVFKVISFPIVAPLMIVIIANQSKDYKEFKQDLHYFWEDIGW
ncbi:hypothetical protein [Paraliobacillus ryukyuensis]|uniref:hypothetical protein n=1 Tax=Paraliobacillus ryukyuensis TaxID=200904 RepID=UPI0009A636D7|nr:hypothetical protein [Paraliobacillus ryukyuensis]